MVRKKSATQIESEAQTQAGSVDLEDVYAAEQLAPALQRLYAEMGIDDSGQAKIYIYKMTAEGKEARVGECHPDEYDLMATAKQFGSGDYVVRIYVPDPNGQLPIRGKRTFNILLPPGEDAKIEETRRAAPTAPPAATMQQHNGSETLTAMQTMMQGFQASITALIEKMVPKEKDPLTTLQGIKELAQVLIPAAPAQGNSMVEALSMIKSVKEIIADGNADANAGEGGFGSAGLRIVEKLFSKGIESGQIALPGTTPPAAQPAPLLPAHKGEPPAAAPIPNATGAAPAQPLAEPAQPDLTEEDEQMLLARIMLARTLRAAQSNKDFAAFAEDVYDEAPEEFITDLLAQPQWLDWIVQNEPRLKQHEGWLTQVRNRILEIAREDGMLTATAEPGNVTANGTDNAGNVTGVKPA